MKSGFVTILGRPNVGKSTFLNTVLKQKIVITSDKAQTTRNTIQGVYTNINDDVQIIFMDTPGIHKPHHELGRIMTENAYQSIKSVDIILFMVSAEDKIGPGDKMIIEKLTKVKKPIFLIINKIDTLKNKYDVDKTILDYKDLLPFKGIFPISAKESINIDKLLDEIKNELEEGPMYYPTDTITDHPERFIIAEFIREKILYFTHDEIPHSVAVIIDSIKPNDEGLLECYASIVVERSSQKGIIIGKNGELLKKVKQLAKRDIERLLGSKIYLELWVKVKNDWRNRKSDLQNFGYGKDNY